MKLIHKYCAIFLALLFINPHKIEAQSLPSLNSKVTVSSFYAGTNPQALVDGNLSLGWNAGAYAPQWANLELTTPQTISFLRLMSGQSPNGQVQFKITLSAKNGTIIFTQIFDRYVESGRWISIPLLSPISDVTHIKLETLSSPSWIAWQELEASSNLSPSNKHLKYFGYYGLVSGGLPLIYNFAEIKSLGNSNVGIIPSHDIPKMREMLTLAKSNNLQVFIMPRNIAYSGSSLKTDYQNILNNLDPVIREFDSSILGFYFDEMIGSGTSIGDFIEITGYLKNIYPTKKILAIESDTPISSSTLPTSYFTHLTDVGFDYYPSVWSTNNQNGWTHYLESWEKLKKLAPNLNYWIIPDGLATTKDQSLRWPELWDKYLGLAMSEDHVVGIMNFIWPSLLPFENYGITYQDVFNPSSPNYNSSLKNLHLKTGKAIISDSSLPGDLNGDGHVNLYDYTELIRGFGTLYFDSDFINIITNYGR